MGGGAAEGLRRPTVGITLRLRQRISALERSVASLRTCLRWQRIPSRTTSEFLWTQDIRSHVEAPQ